MKILFHFSYVICQMFSMNVLRNQKQIDWNTYLQALYETRIQTYTFSYLS